jgi:hypothetical protein
MLTAIALMLAAQQSSTQLNVEKYLSGCGLSRGDYQIVIDEFSHPHIRVLGSRQLSGDQAKCIRNAAMDAQAITTFEDKDAEQFFEETWRRERAREWLAAHKLTASVPTAATGKMAKFAEQVEKLCGISKHKPVKGFSRRVLVPSGPRSISQATYSWLSGDEFQCASSMAIAAGVGWFETANPK